MKHLAAISTGLLLAILTLTPAHAWPPLPGIYGPVVNPPVLTKKFGVKTRLGFGGLSYADLGYAGGGTITITAEHDGSGTSVPTAFCFDTHSALVPGITGATGALGASCSGTYGAAAPSYNGPYTVGLTDGASFNQTLTITIIPHRADVTSIASGTHADTTTVFQLNTMITSPIGTDASTLTLCDTVVGRDEQLNPSFSSFYTIKLPVGLYADGGCPGQNIVITSDNPDLSLDANRMPNEGGGFKWSGLTLNGNANTTSPITFRQTTGYSDQSGAILTVMFSQSNGGSGMVFDQNLFKLGPDVAAPGSTDTLRPIGIVTVTKNHFLNTSTGVGNSVITQGDYEKNIFENINDDAMDTAINSSSNVVKDNFSINFHLHALNHPDTFQPLGVNDGTSKACGSYQRNVSVRGAGWPLSATATGTSSSGSTTVTFAGSVLALGWIADAGAIISGPGVAASSGIHISAIAGDGLSLTLSSAAGAGFGTGPFTVAFTDAQGYFDDNTGAGSRRANCAINNNIHNLTDNNQIYMGGEDNPTTQFNTVISNIQSVPSSTGSILLTSAASGGGFGTGGTINYNAANSITTAGQAGSPTTTPNFTVPKTLTDYNNAFANYSGTVHTPYDVLANFSAASAGTLANMDGTYNGALFPTCPGKANGAWNDGTVWNCSDPTWAAAHPPATWWFGP